MNKSRASRAPRPVPPTSIAELLPPLELLPGEDGALYAGLREALLADLAPGRPYEHALADNLVTLEWEGYRHRRMRDDLIRSAYRSQAESILHSAQYGEHAFILREVSEDVEKTARALVASDARARHAAERELQALGRTPSELLASAYRDVSDAVEIHERKLADIEVRRRRLRDDYDRLKSARARPIEDAEVVDAD